MDGERSNLGTPQFEYETKRVEGGPPIPCDVCLGGLDAPWFLGAYIGETLTYIMCARDAVRFNLLTDTCAACIPDPSDERVCDSCGKEYRRAAPALIEAVA
jgi:hypothetical protein